MIRLHCLWRLIWVYTVCLSLSFRIRSPYGKLITSNQLRNHPASAPASYLTPRLRTPSPQSGWLGYGMQWRSKNGIIFKHIQDNLKKVSLVLLPKYGLLLKERICSQKEQILSFKSSPGLIWKRSISFKSSSYDRLKSKIFYVS